MAKTIVRKFEIDTGDTAQKLEEVKIQLDGIDASIPQEGLPPDLVPEETIENTKSLKAQLKELQIQLQNTEPDSAAYVELSTRASELKDKISDAAEAINTQAGSAFERVGNSASLVTSRLANLDFSGAAEGAQLLASNLGNIKFKDLTEGFKSFGKTLFSIGKSLLTNPIFLIGATLAVAIAYASEFTAGLDGISEADRKNLAIQERKALLAKRQLDDISALENVYKLQGKSEREIANLKLKSLDTALLEQEIVVKTNQSQEKFQIEAAERNYKYLKGFLDFVTLPQRKLTEFFLNFYNKAVDLLNKIPGITIEKIDVEQVVSTLEDVNRFLAEKIFNPKETKKQAEDTTRASVEALNALKNQKAGIELELRALDKETFENRRALTEEQQKTELRELERKAELLERERDLQTRALADRIASSQELIKVLDEQSAAEIALAEFQVETEKKSAALIQDREKALAAQAAIEQAVANVTEVRAKAEQRRNDALKTQSELILDYNTYLNDQKVSQQELIKSDEAFTTSLIKNEIERLEAERNIIEQEKSIRLAALQFDVDKYKEGTQEKLNAQIAYNQAAQQYDQQLSQNKIAIEQATIDRTNELLNIRASLEVGSTDARIAALEAEYEQRAKFYANDAEMLIALETEKQDKIRKLQLDTFTKNLELAQQGLTAIQGFLDASFAKQQQALKATQDAELLAFEQSYAQRFAAVEQGSEAEKLLTESAQKEKEVILKRNEKKQLEFAKKQFLAQKKMQLAGATVDAAKAITSSLSQSPVAIGPIPNPVGIASLALAITTGAASIAKIAATKFESPAVAGDIPSGGLVGGGAEGGTTAQFNPLAASFLEDRPEQITPRAYVLASDVASAAEVRENVADLARIG